MRTVFGVLPAMVKPTVRPVPRDLRTETLRRRGVAVVRVSVGVAS
jgi:hypothetical protein